MGEPMATQTGEAQGWVDEIHANVSYGMAATVLEERQSPCQRVTMIDSATYGRAQLLDGCWMMAERQERY